MTLNSFMTITLLAALCAAAHPLSAEAEVEKADAQSPTILLSGECRGVAESIVTYMPPSNFNTGEEKKARDFKFIVAKHAGKDVWQLSTTRKDGHGLIFLTPLNPMRDPKQLIYMSYLPVEAMPDGITSDVAYSMVLNKGRGSYWYGHFTMQFASVSDTGLEPDLSVAVEAVKCMTTP